ncbi:MAG: RNA ligase (ATP) [Bacteroidetes bacterium]|nr:RNA ligase (ATP) [Bacteroidota bacterium]
MRKLASIQIIKDIKPIKDANVIKAASVLGWQTVIKEGQFNIGDKCVYVEIDSVFPNKPEFADFLNRSNRLKTIRLRGQISQGVCLPVSILPAGNYDVGDDVTEILGIKKYEMPIPVELSGEIKGPFPSFIPKTDEPRVQTAQDMLDKYVGQEFYASEKLDGMSATYYVYNGEFGVCTRNVEIKENENSVPWKIAKTYNIKDKLLFIGENIAIQGELIGKGINKNIYNLDGNDYYVFNVFDIDKYKYMDIFDMQNFLFDILKLKHVPLIEIMPLINDVQDLVKFSTGKSKLNNQACREGLVFRTLKGIQDSKFGRVSFKVINPEYLLNE